MRRSSVLPVVALAIASAVFLAAASWQQTGTARLGSLVDALVLHHRRDALALTPRDLKSVLYRADGTPRPVVVIVPHMDDETFFLGETLAALDERGFDVTVVFTTSSQGGRAMVPSFESDRHAIYKRVASVLGVDRTIIATIPDGARLGGIDAKTSLTEEFVRGARVVREGCVLFTIGGGGHYDHRVAERVGRQLARGYHLPLFVYWGYGPRFKWETAPVKNWGPNMVPFEMAGARAATCMKRKSEAILLYRQMYSRQGWMHYWPSVSRYELVHRDEVGFVPRP